MLTRTTHAAVALLALFVICAEASGLSRQRRSPFKKHKIVVTEAQQEQSDGGGWGAPPPPPPPPAQETIVEHHHHYEMEPPAPPPPSTHSHSLVINVSKGGGKLKGDMDKLNEFKAEVDSTIDAIEQDKKEKLDALKKDAEAKLDALAQIPHMIASDIDFLGKKIVEDIERKKQKEEGISIQIWKGKGGSRQSSASSSEEVHHHHYYPPPPPPPRQTEPPPPPPKKHYGGWEQEAAEGLYKVADAGAQFMDFLAGQAGQFSKGEQASGSIESTEGQGWGQTQGGKGKGFRLSLWKSKGFRR